MKNFSASKFRVILTFCVALILINCQHNWGSFKRYSVVAPKNLEEVGTRVSGRACRFVLSYNSYFLPISNWYWNSIAEASRNALKENPKAIGLKDVEVESQVYVLYNCIYVTGIPVIEINK